MFFKKKEKTPEKEEEKTPKKEKKQPKYVEAWGWAASAARFRGFMCVILGISLIISLALAGLLYTSKNIYVVGVTPEGERSVLSPVSAQVNFDVFTRHFLNLYANYSPSTIRSNLDQAMKLTTKAFRDSFNYVLGTSFIESVINDGIVQNVSVMKTEMTSLQEGRALVKVYATRYRSLGNETRQVVYDIELLAGAITSGNPYGWYVNSIRETNM
jgi:hypothetical protein